MRRVVVTGMSGISSLGSDWPTIRAALLAGKSGIRLMPEWERYTELRTNLGGPVDDFVLPSHFTRKHTRSMGRVAQLATVSAENALRDAGLYGDPIIQNGRMGVAFGSSTGSTDATLEFAKFLFSGSMDKVSGTTYLRMMSHTAAVNIGVMFGLKGRVIPTTSACTSGSQAIGSAYEAIKFGVQDVMIAGGAEELCPSEAATFDTLSATSVRHDQPQSASRPFDSSRDGLVIGEGAASLILEEREHAIARGAKILSELVGYGSNSDGGHITQPTATTMETALRLSLADAQVHPDAVGYVCAHGTATAYGDVAESHASRAVFQRPVAISSFKGHLGHTLGACGALEAWWTLAMMTDAWFFPTLNLLTVDPRCADLDFLTNSRAIQTEYVMSNNFAFGGINTSLVFRRTP